MNRPQIKIVKTGPQGYPWYSSGWTWYLSVGDTIMAEGSNYTRKSDAKRAAKRVKDLFKETEFSEIKPIKRQCSSNDTHQLRTSIYPPLQTPGC